MKNHYVQVRITEDMYFALQEAGNHVRGGASGYVRQLIEKDLEKKKQAKHHKKVA